MHGTTNVKSTLFVEIGRVLVRSCTVLSNLSEATIFQICIREMPGSWFWLGHWCALLSLQANAGRVS